jgi:hypothetical protein
MGWTALRGNLGMEVPRIYNAFHRRDDKMRKIRI